MKTKPVKSKSKFYKNENKCEANRSRPRNKLKRVLKKSNSIFLEINIDIPKI